MSGRRIHDYNAKALQSTLLFDENGEVIWFDVTRTGVIVSGVATTRITNKSE